MKPSAGRGSAEVLQLRRQIAVFFPRDVKGSEHYHIGMGPSCFVSRRIETYVYMIPCLQSATTNEWVPFTEPRRLIRRCFLVVYFITDSGFFRSVVAYPRTKLHPETSTDMQYFSENGLVYVRYFLQRPAMSTGHHHFCSALTPGTTTLPNKTELSSNFEKRPRSAIDMLIVVIISLFIRRHRRRTHAT